jgi:hypothetical protein
MEGVRDKGEGEKTETKGGRKGRDKGRDKEREVAGCSGYEWMNRLGYRE